MLSFTCPHYCEEHFVHQFLQPLMECGPLVNRNNRWYFDMSSDTRADCLTVFYTSCLAAEAGDASAFQCFLPSLQAAAGLHAFLIRAGSAEFLKNVDFVKGQIAGPLTVALEMKDEKGRPAYYDDDLRDYPFLQIVLFSICLICLNLVPGSCTQFGFNEKPI